MKYESLNLFIFHAQLLQVMHAKHNLYETAAKDDTINLTSDEQNIPEQIHELEQKYIERRKEPVRATFFIQI